MARSAPVGSERGFFIHHPQRIFDLTLLLTIVVLPFSTTLMAAYAGLLPYTIATLGGLLLPYFTLAICAGVAIYDALPSTSTEPQPPGLGDVADDLDADRA